MKRILVLLAVVGLGSLLWAAAPVNNSVTSSTVALDTVDLAHGASLYTKVHSLKVTITDSADVRYVAHGTVYLDPGERVWIYLCTATNNDSAKDSCHFFNDVNPRNDKRDTIRWGLSFLEQRRSQTNLDDSAVVLMRKEGSSSSQVITAANTYITAALKDHSAS